jgi:hypothetical protein
MCGEKYVEREVRKLGFSKLFCATPEVWVATKVVCAREKMSYEPQKVLNLRFLTPFGQALRLEIESVPYLAQNSVIAFGEREFCSTRRL